MGSTKDISEDFMVPSEASQVESVKSEPKLKPETEPKSESEAQVPGAEEEAVGNGTTETQVLICMVEIYLTKIAN